MIIKVKVEIASEDYGVAKGEVETTSMLDEDFNALAHAIIDAIPAHMFPRFDALEICNNGEVIGHAEK